RANADAENTVAFAIATPAMIEPASTTTAPTQPITIRTVHILPCASEGEVAARLACCDAAHRSRPRAAGGIRGDRDHARAHLRHGSRGYGQVDPARVPRLEHLEAARDLRAHRRCGAQRG